MRLAKNNIVHILALSGFVALAIIVRSPRAEAAACAAPTTDYGSVTSTINVTSAGNYRVWSRIQQPSTTANSYSLEVDGATAGAICHNSIGGNAGLAINTWNWVDYKAGNSATKVDVTLSAGSHTIKMIGDSDGLLLDRVILTSINTDGTTCTPTSTGDNCVTVANVAPTVSVSASPTSGTAPLNTTLTATPADSDGTITSVEFFRGTTSLGTKTAAPWTWPITGLAAGSYTYTAKATDNDGAATSSSNVTVTANAPPTNKPGDANGDGVINIYDASILSLNWNLTGRTFAQGDFDGNGTVNIYDASILSINWGK
ncbi:MAG: dockerin type I domain-containing protein [Candidatus Saccharibacteria bacterium]|nr:dockerin type I domain-containing protein [Candidatus Saccharibacteria bacterium]